MTWKKEKNDNFTFFFLFFFKFPKSFLNFLKQNQFLFFTGWRENLYIQSSYRLPLSCVFLRVIHKVDLLRFCNFKPLFPLFVHILFSLHRILPSTSTRIIFFKEHLTDIFCELLSIKEPQTMLQNKETTVQSYQKMLNLSTKKSPGVQGCTF